MCVYVCVCLIFQKCAVQILTPPCHPPHFLLIESVQSDLSAALLHENAIYSPNLFISSVVLCREIVDHPYITEIPANSFRGITNNVLTV